MRLSAVLLAAAAACVDPRPSSGARDASPEASAVDAASARDAASPGARLALLEVPRARGRIEPRGHFRIEVWDGAPSTGTLLDRQGLGAVPVSEARFLWGDGSLCMFFYAGDLNLEAHVDRHDGPIWKDDSVELAFGGAGDDKRIVRVSVTGVVADGLCPSDAADLSDPRCDLRWESGTRAATDSDGTLNRVDNRDEEWAVEAVVPLASLGSGPWVPGAHIPLRLSRCEVAHDGPRACGAWDGTLVLGATKAERSDAGR